MPRLLERRSVHLVAIMAWGITLAAVAFLADSTAPFMAVVWAGICVALAYQILTRRWWTAIALVVLGAQTVLNVMTESDHSKLEHRAVFGAELVVIAYSLIAIAVDDKARRRSRSSHP